jgi:hypothetical protein
MAAKQIQEGVFKHVALLALVQGIESLYLGQGAVPVKDGSTVFFAIVGIREPPI